MTISTQASVPRFGGPSELTPEDQERARGLKRMRTLALSLLILATLIFLATPADMNAPGERANAEVELTYNWPAEDGSAPEVYTGGRNFGHLAYRVDDIYAVCQRVLDAGHIVHRPPRDGHMAFVKTPDGISIELLQDGVLEPAEPWKSMPNTGNW